MNDLLVNYKKPAGTMKIGINDAELETPLHQLRLRYHTALIRIYGKDKAASLGYHHPYYDLVSNEGLQGIRDREQYWVDHLSAVNSKGQSRITDQGDHLIKGQIRKLRILRNEVFGDQEPILPKIRVGSQLSIFAYTHKEAVLHKPTGVEAP